MIQFKKLILIFSTNIIIFFLEINSSNSQTIEQKFINSIQSPTGITTVSDISLIQNPAGLSVIDSNLFCINFVPNKFGLKELNSMLIFFAHKIDDGWTAGISTFGTGNELYNEFSGALHTSVTLSEKLILGGSLEVSRISIKGNLPDLLIQGNIGAVIKFSPQLISGFSLSNITRSYYEYGANTVNQQAILGVGLIPAEDLFLELATVITINQNSGVSVSGKYNLINFLAVRLAYLTNPQILELGCNFNLSSKFKLITSASYHNYLGFSQQIGFSFIW